MCAHADEVFLDWEIRSDCVKIQLNGASASAAMRHGLAHIANSETVVIYLRDTMSLS